MFISYSKAELLRSLSLKNENWNILLQLRLKKYGFDCIKITYCEMEKRQIFIILKAYTTIQLYLSTRAIYDSAGDRNNTHPPTCWSHFSLLFCFFICLSLPHTAPPATANTGELRSPQSSTRWRPVEFIKRMSRGVNKLL